MTKWFKQMLFQYKTHGEWHEVGKGGLPHNYFPSEHQRVVIVRKLLRKEKKNEI